VLWGCEIKINVTKSWSSYFNLANCSDIGQLAPLPRTFELGSKIWQVYTIQELAWDLSHRWESRAFIYFFLKCSSCVTLVVSIVLGVGFVLHNTKGTSLFVSHVDMSKTILPLFAFLSCSYFRNHGASSCTLGTFGKPSTNKGALLIS
jgi:hypothetical protein